MPSLARAIAALADDVLHALALKVSETQGLPAIPVPVLSRDPSVTGAASSPQGGARIALKLLGSGAASARTQALGGVSNPTTAFRAAPDHAVQGIGARIVLSAKAATDCFGPSSEIARAVPSVLRTLADEPVRTFRSKWLVLARTASWHEQVAPPLEQRYLTIIGGPTPVPRTGVIVTAPVRLSRGSGLSIRTAGSGENAC